MKIKIPAVPIVLTIVFFALFPKAHAVSPAPDGGYAGGNTAEGQNALLSLTTGGFNTAIGFLSLRSNTTGSFNTGVGAGTLLANTADENTATGAGALLSNTTGYQNTANGTLALFSNTTGNSNTADGFFALFNNISGTGNTAIGSDAGSGVTTASDVICISTSGQNVNSTTWINNIYGVTTVSGSTLPVVVSDTHQLGTASSSRRFKKEIKPMDQASEAILALKPVTFHYKSDNTGTPQFGLIAEDVAEVNPDLVVRDKKGEIYTVRYDAVNAMLLNEFLKEHRKVEQQQATITELKSTVTKQEASIAQQRKDFEATIIDMKKGMETLAARSKEQDAKIQKVTDQIEMSRPAPQMVLNNP